MTSTVWNREARAARAAPAGLSLAMGTSCWLRRGVGALAASGAFKRSMLGTGIGIGIFVFGSSMVTKYWVAKVPSYEKLSESMLVFASRLILMAGCGPPNSLLISRPQYARLLPGFGARSR